jgi:hypothetical protein
MSRIKWITKLFAGLILAVCTVTACSDSTSGNEDMAAESEIESRWAAIVEIATNPNLIQDADVAEFKGYLSFPYTIVGRISDDPNDEEVITEEEFDQYMAETQGDQSRNVIINSMVLISIFDVVGGESEDPDIRISGNSATRTVSIPVPTMPDHVLGSHVGHWVQIGGEWYLQGVDLLIEEPEF